MANCLVTKLKENVNNNNLLKIGVIRFDINFEDTPNNDRKIRTQGNWVKSYKVVGNGKMYLTLSDAQNDTNGFTETPENFKAEDLFYSAGRYSIDLYSKYELPKLIVASSTYSGIKVKELSDIKYSSGLSILKCTFIYGDISILPMLPLTQIEITESDGIYGDIASLANLALTSLTLSETKVSGDIASLANMSALTTLNLSYTDCSGDVNVFTDNTKFVNLTSLNLRGCDNIPNRISTMKAAIEAAHPGITVIW